MLNCAVMGLYRTLAKKNSVNSSSIKIVKEIVPSSNMRTPCWKDVVAHREEDVDSNSGRTEDSLLSSRTSRETVDTKKRKQSIAECCRTKVQRHWWQYKYLISSIFLIIFGILQIIFPPYEILLSLRARMIPGLPPFEWWLYPPDEVVAKIYVFNVTNSDSFSNGTDTKLKLQEIGPIIYREKLRHTNPIFNENGTLTYTTNRTLIYLPERNPTNFLNQTITMPNIAVLFVPTFFSDATFFIRFGVNLMMRKLNSQFFKTATIHEFLWNATDPILDVSQNIAPSLVPIKNVGILAKIYKNFSDNVTVYIGPKYNQRDFFKIDNVDGTEYIPLREGKCDDKVQGSSEGIAYYHDVRKSDTLRYYRKTICRVGDLKYTGEVEKYGLKGYRYELVNNFYNRTQPTMNDCYKGQPSLPDGLIDVSPCHYDMSVAASNPHFLHAHHSVLNSVEGLQPDPKIHTSFVDVEPVTGVPMQGQAQSQLNIVMKDLSGFTEKLHKFSHLNIPLVWVEYNQEGIPPKIQWLLYFQVILVPILQKVFLVLTFVVAFLFLVVYVRRRRRFKGNIQQNTALAFESEKFLKK